jgi:hypothetical protein
MSEARRGGSLAAAAVAVLFGVATVMAGGRVLLGISDPGYVVFRPLLIYNTAMGVAYVAAGVAMWRCLRCGVHAAAIVFALNLLVLVAIFAVYSSGGAVAVESLGAMSFRTAVWLALLWILRWAGRKAS